jgi:tetratricopeptide (TPR) repeat protein
MKILIGILVIAALAFVSIPSLRTPSSANAIVTSALPASWSGNERLIPKIQDRLKQEPLSPEWNTALGHAYLQKARETGDPTYYKQAEELFDRALSSKRNYVDALIGQGILALSRHEFRKARDTAEGIVRLNPDVVATYGVLADALVELGEYDAAIRTLDTMVKKKPNLNSYSRISYMRELTGDIEGAIQMMQMAIDSGAPDAENTAWCMVQLANLYLQSGRLTEADRQNRMALMRFPNYVHAFAGLARISVAQKDFVAASHWYQKAIDRVPLPEFLIALGEVYEHLGKSTEAWQQFDLVRAIQKIYRANGVNIDLEMVVFDADHGGDIDDAVEIARREWNRRKSVKVADAYAWALYRAGRLHEAREMIPQALRLGTRDPLILEHAAMINH